MYRLLTILLIASVVPFCSARADNGGTWFWWEGSLAIPDNQCPPVVTAPITVSGMSAVTDVDVRIWVSHLRNSDLYVYLRGPNGVQIELSTNNGGNSQDYNATVFDDEATTSITAGTGPFFADFHPEQLLSMFDGIDPNGIWTLEICDDAGGNAGTLTYWDIQIAELPQVDDSGGTWFGWDSPVAILTYCANGVDAFPITVSGMHIVTDVEVRINLVYTFDDDLRISLRGPNEAQIPLSTNNGGESSNYTNTVFDDEAATLILYGSGPFTGDYQPEQLLQSFDGLDANGIWTLELCQIGGGGYMNSWEIKIKAECQSVNNVVVKVLTPSLNRQLHFYARQDGFYQVWSTTDRMPSIRHRSRW